MDYAIGLNDVRNRHRGCSTLLVRQNELAALHHGGQGAALHGGQRRLTPAGLDLVGNILRGELTRNYVVR